MKKVIAILVAAVLCVTVFAACSKTETVTTTDAEVETIASEFAGQTLTMGSSCDFAPYEYIGDDGSYVGIDVEIATAVCAKLGATLEIKDMKFDGILAAVQSKAVSFGMSGFTVTEERKESVNFSTSYEKAVQVILTKADGDIKSQDDVKGKKISVQAGTTGETLAQKEFGKDAVNSYDKYNLAIQALLNDQVDCCILDNYTAKAFIDENPELVSVETDSETEEYAVAFNKEDTALLDAWNAAYDALVADGTIDAILDKYHNATNDSSEETEVAAEETSEKVAETTEATAEETTAA